MSKYILALDQGTTSSRAIIFDKKGEIKMIRQQEFDQIYSEPGWVEHDPLQIWQSQAQVAAESLSNEIAPNEVAAIGITNQRETTIIWERKTGTPIYNAIVWQDRRTAGYCDYLKEKGWEDEIKEKTGLLLDAYFSGTKIKWILDHIEGAREAAENGELAFGTVDSWLVWNLTQGLHHVTDVSNASRTMLYNIQSMEWDEELLELMDIPRAILPEVKSSSEIYGQTCIHFFGEPIPIAGIAGDQQAALFGQMCLEQGMVKNTYGTGCFILTNTGSKLVKSRNNLLTTVAWKIGNETTYALEGSVFVAGAVVQWIRDGLELIESADEIEELASTENNNGGVYFVPAFVGLGAPHWDQYARGSMQGITRGTTKGHLARAALESICFQSKEVIDAMSKDAGIRIKELRVDGGASANDLLMQIQSDAMGIKVIRPKIVETTALGAAYFAGLAVGFWKDVNEIKKQWIGESAFDPEKDMTDEFKVWSKAVERSKEWLK